MNPITASFGYTGGIQTYNVTVNGTYDLSGFGAGGGGPGSGANTGGSGAQIGGTFDLIAGQQLQIIVGGLAVSDGAGWRDVPLDDAGLYAGFHHLEREAGKSWRWTDGEAHLSPGLWAGLTGPMLMRITGQFAGLGPVEASEDERAAA